MMSVVFFFISEHFPFLPPPPASRPSTYISHYFLIAPLVSSLYIRPSVSLLLPFLSRGFWRWKVGPVTCYYGRNRASWDWTGLTEQPEQIQQPDQPFSLFRLASLSHPCWTGTSRDGRNKKRGDGKCGGVFLEARRNE